MFFCCQRSDFRLINYKLYSNLVRILCNRLYVFPHKITYLDAASLHSFDVIHVTQNARRIETEFVRDTVHKCSRWPPHKLSYLKRISEKGRHDAKRISVSRRCHTN